MNISIYAIPGLQLTPGVLTKAVCEIYNLPPENIYQKTRQREYVDARRHLFYYRRKELLHRSKDIEAESGFDHATIRHACKTAKALLATDRQFKKQYNLFLEKIK